MLDIPAGDIAQLCGFTLETYEKVERGEVDPGISGLTKIAKRYDIALDVLMFGEEPHMRTYFVTRKGQGLKADRSKDYSYQSLASGFSGRKVDPYIVKVDPLPEGEERPKNSHEGQEFDMIIEGTMELTEGVIEAVNASLLPLMAIFLVITAVFVVPLLYRLRMTDYVLYDHPEAGALYAIRESKKMMRFHRLSVFKLDLSFWWFYLALALSYALNYAPMFLSVSGISLPVEGEALSVLCFLLSCAAEFVVIYFLRSRMEVTCALAYNQLKPKEQSTGAVLGNIFQM